MADREQRRPTAASALILLALLLAVPAFVACGKSEAKDVPSAPAPPAEPDPETLARAARYEADVRSIVAKHIEQARKLTKNKVHVDNVAVSVHVRERGGLLTFGFDDDLPLAPASNMKLLTSASALLLLGPAWSFETRIEAAGPIEDGVLLGDLVVRAAGDPLYDPTGSGDVGRLLAPAMEALALAGIRRVDGDLVLDERGFKEPGPFSGWPGEKQHWTEYCALSGGFSVNRGCMTVSVKPGAAGQPARVTAVPTGHGLERSFDVSTESDGKIVVSLFTRPGKLYVRGKISAKSATYTESCSHTDPVDLFGQVLAARLDAEGIVLAGSIRRERGASSGDEVAVIRTPLVDYLEAINTESINAVADQVFLATGQAIEGAGTVAGGARATALALTRLGIGSEGFVQADGSGLSRENRVTARQLTALVSAVLELDPETARHFRDSLAVAGETGTLSKRMRDSPARGRVLAKTGFISGVSSLSGVAATEAGRELVFSVLVEYPSIGGLNTSCWKPMQDEICALLVGPSP